MNVAAPDRADAVVDVFAIGGVFRNSLRPGRGIISESADPWGAMERYYNGMEQMDTTSEHLALLERIGGWAGV